MIYFLYRDLSFHLTLFLSTTFLPFLYFLSPSCFLLPNACQQYLLRLFGLLVASAGLGFQSFGAKHTDPVTWRLPTHHFCSCFSVPWGLFTPCQPGCPPELVPHSGPAPKVAYFGPHNSCGIYIIIASENALTVVRHFIIWPLSPFPLSPPQNEQHESLSVHPVLENLTSITK